MYNGKEKAEQEKYKCTILREKRILGKVILEPSPVLEEMKSLR